ncbi:CPS-53 (KpLE1) prophage; bactoprenol glucosyl transferase [Alteromonas macleodii]|uniref:glycosyltransferase family 2 protein n=1 Tax=Alteromonas macleodii TaxID=28108 RepID=UPI00066C7E72|nr:glycosyltransferase family 2 protein [Alteromonas macleodii]MBG60343.1 glycosyltransferase [Peredibacter sp.]CAI3949887.1 Glycosyltransferase involved in cell wall bisynthesis [Alteromonas macleodii]VTP51893.1 Glycosyltransferase involved in cell wall bisynthesis [Alteromonas macleodii]|tara:strand:+ start:13378 stop:14310 length:933 start_codon:yes stop_codon:yes gene_type:complete
MDKISLVVPVFNEEEVINIFYEKVRAELSQYQVQIVFIDDGSSDKTLEITSRIASSDENVKVLSFIKNFGKEPALFAGLEHSDGDAVIPIDVDLQDPIEVVHELIAKWREGYEMVLAKRANRDSDTYLKRKTAQWFYSFHNKISNTKIEENVGDFRLLDKKIVQSIIQLEERNLFMKAILSWCGGKTAIVEYSRDERAAGTTKFNGWKLWNLALEGITGFSTVPLRMWTYIGFMISSLSFGYGLLMIVEKLIWGNAVPGYPSLMVSVLFLGGVQLIGIGVLGEYIGRIYVETKRRPRYILNNTSSNKDVE